MTDEVKPVRRLVETARMHPAGAMPTETHQSLPVPLFTGSGDGAVGFLFAPTALQMGAGLWVFPPTYRAIVTAREAVFEEMRRVTPADFGLDDDPAKALGTYGLPRDVTAEQYTALKERLYDDYDALLPWFFGGDVAPPASVRRVAEDFRVVFHTLSEHVLQRYYRAFGRRFFTWVDSVSA